MFSRLKTSVTRLSRKEKGDHAEQLALDYLSSQGLELLQRNYRCRVGEIDLVMYDPLSSNTVFVEVRYRKNSHFGGAAGSVTPQKQQRISKTALHYIQQHGPSISARFDVVAIEGGIEGKNTINWIKNAF